MKSGFLAGLVLFCTAAVGVALLLWLTRRNPLPAPDEIPRWSADRIAALSEGGWADTFDEPVDRATPLPQYDGRWTGLFGSLEVLPELQVASGTEGREDGGDDYAFFRREPPMGSVEITAEGWWGGAWRSLGVQGAVQPESPHRLYEVALWEGALSIFYFHGPSPGDYETLARVEVGDLDPGFYRLTFRTLHSGSEWSLGGTLTALAPEVEIARVEAVDDRLPGTGYQGIGVLSGVRTFISGVAVRALD